LWTVDETDPFGVFINSADGSVIFQIYPVETYTNDFDELAADVLTLLENANGEALELGRSEIETATDITG
jgi:hypothetical protein